MAWKSTNARARLLCGAAAASLSLWASAASAQDAAEINIPPQSLSAALYAFAGQSGHQVMFAPELTGAKMTRGVSGVSDQQEALRRLLVGTDLAFVREGDTFLIVKADQGPQSGSAAGGGAEVETLIVTAQKREENIQDVPIAISAFTSKDLEEQKIEGGFDLLKAIPNVTFSKNNFTSYNFSIRGIGTKAVSATTDPGVAVSFNNIALLQNRLFEQEYFDVERVEVLRGPQGTLYGRNATSGVINVISAKPDLSEFDGWIKGEVGNYHSKRASAMINVPIIEDKLAVRLAGAFTDRQGYDFNEGTGNAVNGRDLWSARLTLGFNPTESIRTNLIWERFNEDDNRSRTGKQLCHRDPGPTVIGDTPNVGPTPEATLMDQAFHSQGCKPGSLYDDAAFGTPNGLALPFVFGMIMLNNSGLFPLNSQEGQPAGLLQTVDPYGGRMQSRDLRVIDSIKDPTYRAKADLVQFNLDLDVTDQLTLSSQTAYNEDQTYSAQDYNRFNTDRIFNDTSNFSAPGQINPTAYQNFAPGGFFDDPQLGKSDKLVGYDIAQAKGKQFTQELRLQSDYDGPLNFSVGAHYTRFKTLVDYYVFYNLITATAMTVPFNYPFGVPGAQATIYTCYTPKFFGFQPLVNEPIGTPGTACPYIDPNPIESINGDGHNYFRSKNPYKLKSWAAFGELYWQVAEDLKVTAGLRYTDDHKTFIPVPTQVLLAEGIFGGGDVNRGYPEDPPLEQKWGEWTGRLGVDWKLDLPFTDDTLLYAFYSHGYKAGGANPPEPGFSDNSYQDLARELLGFPIVLPPHLQKPVLFLTQKDYGPTFEPEFVDAFEVGAKNTLMDGALTFNTTAFFYDYTDYQVSQIKNRTAVNENFDAQAWGIEFESLFAPSRNLQIVANLGYLDTEIAEGETSIDIMNRTQDNPNVVLAKPWIQLPANCVMPLHMAEIYAADPYAPIIKGRGPCGGTAGFLDANPHAFIDPLTGQQYDPNYYDGINHPLNINGGAGIRADLGGNELPNAPHWTMNVGAQYGMDFLEDWRVTVRGDAYWQSQSWARVYNVNGGIDNFGNEYGAYDKLHGWYNVNLSVWFEKPDADLKIELYAKNVLDKTPITDAFLNSDDTALTTNVFVLDPRLIGLSIRKGF